MRPFKHPGIGNLELAEREVVDISGTHIGRGERRGQPIQPSPKEILHGSWPQAAHRSFAIRFSGTRPRYCWQHAISKVSRNPAFFWTSFGQELRLELLRKGLDYVHQT